MKRRTDPLSAAVRRSLRRDLLRWYGREKRDLPWRASRDPYRVWISEAMLQQTRVETVIGYYRRFLERFPTVEALARARTDSVLAAWSGLGYYRRARSLHEAARAVRDRHGGRFPRDREALIGLPGVGAYSAGAIASIAFDQPEPLVDGNVARVFSRLFALEGAPGSAGLRKRLWEIAATLVPRRGAGEWNQALMELGALVCVPRVPDCGRCPLASRCRALAEDRVDEFPSRGKRATPIPVDVVVFAVRRGDRWLLERRPAGGRMAGLWQLPTVELPASGGVLFPLRPPASIRIGRPLCEVRHTITRHRIRALVKSGTVDSGRPAASLAWVNRQAMTSLPLTGMTRKCVSAILAAHPGPAPAAFLRS
ncbi:MAG: A/G-specific adenine glycosylase [Planctomycetota bacterium]